MIYYYELSTGALAEKSSGSHATFHHTTDFPRSCLPFQYKTHILVRSLSSFVVGESLNSNPMQSSYLRTPLHNPVDSFGAVPFVLTGGQDIQANVAVTVVLVSGAGSCKLYDSDGRFSGCLF
jgi:hypothetical protein